MNPLLVCALTDTGLVELPTPSAARDVHDLFAATQGVPAVYSALRTYHGNRFLRLDAHFARCRRGIDAAGWDAHFDFEALAAALDESARGAGGADVRLRFDLLSQAVAVDGVDTRVLIGRAPHIPVPEDVLSTGALLELAPRDLARRQPKIKFTAWITERLVCRQRHPEVLEHLLVDQQGRVLEGISSNFFAVRNRTLITAGDGILEGITRQLTLELAEQRGFSIELRRPSVVELASCDEAFISSSTRELVPVVAVAGVRVGRGKPGPVFAALADDYRSHVETHAESAV